MLIDPGLASSLTTPWITQDLKDWPPNDLTRHRDIHPSVIFLMSRSRLSKVPAEALVNNHTINCTPARIEFYILSFLLIRRRRQSAGERWKRGGDPDFRGRGPRIRQHRREENVPASVRELGSNFDSRASSASAD